MEEKTEKTNKWVFANLGENISKQIWEIGQAYADRFKGKEGRLPHINSHPMQLLKYWYFLYLTGSRLMEPVLEPPTIAITNEGGKVWVQITKVNEKHKSIDGTAREMIDQVFPVFNEWEQKMWVLITDGGLALSASEIFRFQEWKSIKKENLSCLIKTNFRADLRDTRGKLHRESGITPHILRHMRAFSVVVNYGVEVPLVVKWFGWTDQRMLYYYAHIRTKLSTRNQVEMLKRSNMLTNLPIDLGKSISAY